jgi:SAM-dependent methyltransferase
MHSINDPTREARVYQHNRYRSVDQAWVNRREQHLVKTLLTSYGLAGSSVLDIPCGYGRLFPLYTCLGMDFIGVDLNPGMLQLATQYDQSTGQGRILHGSIFDLPFAGACFDVVLCIRLLHHQFHDAERQRLVSELARVSRRYVLLSYYHFDWLHACSCFLRWRKKRRVPTILSDTDLDGLVWANGLKILSTCPLLRYGHMQTLTVLEKR